MREARNARRGQTEIDWKGGGGGKGADFDIDSFDDAPSSLDAIVLGGRERLLRHQVRWRLSQ
jgi:hypothetical protein